MQGSPSGFRLVLKRLLFTPAKGAAELVKQGSTHDLLQGLGYIRQSQSGLVHWLPLGLRCLRNVEGIVRKRMDECGGQELLLSTLSPEALWQRTGRWENKELFKLRDSKGKKYCLSATCEEDVTWLMSECLESYKDLPSLVYQIGTKYRDELRPRGGLLRSREFLMKDAYSFHADSQDAMQMFHKMKQVYDQIFTDLKVPFKSAAADCGSIGGELSREYHYLHEKGEDVLYSCNSCSQVSNVEMCASTPTEPGLHTGDVAVAYALNQVHDTLLCLYYPADRTLNWNLALSVMDNDIDMTLAHAGNERVLELFLEQNTDPMFSSVVRVMDSRLSSRAQFPDFPLQTYLKNNFSQLNGHSLVHATQGELCGDCGKGTLDARNSIEVGHCFYLGRTYSEALGATVRMRTNETSCLEMGCYGIGISRLVGAIAEVTRDSKGLCWPSCVAPYKVSLNYAAEDENVRTVRSMLSLDAFESPAGTSLGASLQLSQQLGIPLSVIVGKKSWPHVEIEVRGRRFSDTWRTDHQKHHEQYGWRAVPATDGAREKHYCLPEHLDAVLAALLRDL
ncbi:AaceriACR233Wp [[Ashbya] aceris (nom. inval.)]|nr:AaceriACR233Wp [[Ashbya] aceris (nom. inval.)]